MHSHYFFYILFLAAGVYTMWRAGQQVRRNRYLQKHGIRGVGVITKARIERVRDKPISHFTVNYYDQQHHLHQAELSAPDSEDEFLYLVGGEVPLYIDPYRPERCVLTQEADSYYQYLPLAIGVFNTGVGLYLLQKFVL